MKKFVNVVLLLVLFIMSIMNCFLANRLADKTEELIELSNLENELIIVDSVKFDTVFIKSKEIVKLPIVDTLVLTDTLTLIEFDSVDVVLPIELKHYSDTLAETAFSFDIIGFNCELKDLYVHNLIVCPEQQKVPKKWYDNFGIGFGLGATYIDKFRLVPTIGIYYKLL